MIGPLDEYFQGDAEVMWDPVEILDWKRFKKAVISCGIHSPFVEQMLNSGATRNRIVPQDWKYLATAILEAGSQLQ